MISVKYLNGSIIHDQASISIMNIAYPWLMKDKVNPVLVSSGKWFISWYSFLHLLYYFVEKSLVCVLGKYSKYEGGWWSSESFSLPVTHEDRVYNPAAEYTACLQHKTGFEITIDLYHSYLKDPFLCLMIEFTDIQPVSAVHLLWHWASV